MIPNSVKRYIKKVLVIKINEKKFNGSRNYWEERYKAAKTSGSGSYGRLAEFKAEVLNKFVEQHQILAVIELGCGDGNQLGLAHYPNYRGYDVSQTAIKFCLRKFKEDRSKEFYLMNKINKRTRKADLVISLDVIYHLIEDKVFDNYMRQLFAISSKYVIIYSSNYDDHFAPHVKCRKFTDWVDLHVGSSWRLIEKIENKYPFEANDPDNTSISDFYIYRSNFELEN